MESVGVVDDVGLGAGRIVCQPPPAGVLERVLDSLGAAVEKRGSGNARHAAGFLGLVDEQLRHRAPVQVVVARRWLEQDGGLMGDDGGDLRVGGTEVVDRVACAEVKVAAPLHVDEP